MTERNGSSAETPLTWSQIFIYGGLAVPLAALNLPLYVYLPTFYAEQMGLGLASVGTILLLARIIDTVTDPVLGEISDRTRGRFGQRRPWLALSAPLLLIASYMLFVPGDTASAFYLFLWSSLAYLAWTAILLNYAAWGAELSGDYHERTRITSVREGLVIAGIILAAALPALSGTEPSSGEALWVVFLVVAIGLPVTLLPPLIILADTAHVQQRRAGMREGLKVAWQNRPFKRLVSAYFLNGVANGLPATLFLLFVNHVLNASAQSGVLLLIYFGSGVLAIPIWLRISRRFGKDRAWMGSMLWACLIFVWVPFLGAGDVVLFGIICALSGLSLGADLALPSAMQADVVDLDRLRSGRRRTGFFFAIWSMATKLALACAVGLAFPILDWVGFSTEGDNNTNELLSLAILYGLVPVLFKGLATALVWGFEIDAQTQRELRDDIRQAERA
ncbi:MAG: MFS transporter [Pseudomonadota bacterium]